MAKKNGQGLRVRSALKNNCANKQLKMHDPFSPEKRSSLMASIKSANTRPEVRVRSVLHRRGYRFRLHVPDLPGRPDIVLPRHQTVVLVHGCFWHQHPGCSKSRLPTNNRSWWRSKFTRNVERDRENHEALRALGWHVIVVWGCQTRSTEQIEVVLSASGLD